jgi:hypothetical protein
VLPGRGTPRRETVPDPREPDRRKPLYDPFYADALSADIRYVEAACNEALMDLAAFGRKGGVPLGSADVDVDVAAVLASLVAAGGGLPSQVGSTLDAWERFIDDYSEVSRGLEAGEYVVPGWSCRSAR